MLRPSIMHVPKIEDQRRLAFRHFLTLMSELNMFALADEHNDYFGTFVFKVKEGAMWDIIKDVKCIECEKENPRGLRSRYIAAFKTKTEADRIWMTVKKGIVMQSAYGLYEIKKEDKDCTYTIHVSMEEVPNKSLEIKDTGVLKKWTRYAHRTRDQYGTESPWGFTEGTEIKSFIPYFKLRASKLPALRNDMVDYFK